MDRLKIYFVAPAYPLRGGIAHFVAILHNHLKNRGHQSKIYSFTLQYPKFLFPGKTQEEESKEFIPVEAEPIFSSINPISWIATFLKIRKDKPDLVIFKYWMPFFAPGFGTICLLIRLFKTTKTLFLCDNIISHEQWPGEAFITRLVLRVVDYFIVQSASVKDDLIRLHPKANYKEVAHPLYDVFSSDAFSHTECRAFFHLQPEQPVILFFGFIKPYKGLMYLIRAIPQVLEHLPQARFLIAGEFYENRESYVREIEALQIGHAVQLYEDYIPNEQVGRFFTAADVVVLPYVSATQSGIVQIAYGFNKPIITTDVGGLPEVVIHEKTGFIVPPKDSKKLAEAIIRFFNEKRAEEFTCQIREERKKYSWEPMVAAVEEFASLAKRADNGC